MISVMAAVMVAQAALIYQVENRTSWAAGAGIGAAVMLFIFQGAFTVGFQATVWVYPYVRGRLADSLVPRSANTHAAQIRGAASASTSARLIHLNCGQLDVELRRSKVARLAWRNKPRQTERANVWSQFIVQLTPIAIENIGWKTYIIFAVLNTLWVPLIYLFFPETKGLELEDVDRLFAKGDALLALGGKPNSPTIVDDAEGHQSYFDEHVASTGL